MKKFLYGTTALFAVGAFAGTAMAADPIKLGLGGYWVGMAQFGSNETGAGGDDGLRDHGFGQESEIYFSGSTALDNGIKFGVMVQLEGETSGDQIDNTYIWSSGAFGRVEYGETWGPSLLMSYGSVGEKNRTGDFASFGPSTARNDLGVNSFGGGAGISQLPTEKLAYYTPRMSGVQVGVSYAPEPKNANANGARDSDVGNAASVAATTATTNTVTAASVQRGAELIDVGINYTGKIGSGNVAVFGSTWTSNTEPAGIGGAGDADVDGYSLGGQVSVNNVTIGGRWTKIEDFGGRDNDRTNWRVGANYGMGAWSIGATYQNAELDQAVSSDETTYWSVGLNYTAGPGITFGGGIVNYKYDDNANVNTAEGDENFGILWSRFAF